MVEAIEGRACAFIDHENRRLRYRRDHSRGIQT